MIMSFANTGEGTWIIDNAAKNDVTQDGRCQVDTQRS